MARELASSETAPFWVVAHRQDAGRGRLGRRWVSEPGNLYATLCLRDPADAEHLGSLGLVVGLGLRRALSRFVPSTELRLKWPNDVMLRGAKVAGVLLETFATPTGRHVTIGCGINCAHHPRDTLHAATDLAAAGFPLTPDALFPSVREDVENAVRDWGRGSRFAALRDEWLASAHGLGDRAVVRVPNGTIEGIVETIDESGQLVLTSGPRRERISAGDLHITRLQTAE